VCDQSGNKLMYPFNCELFFFCEVELWDQMKKNRVWRGVSEQSLSLNVANCTVET
jgi:hypothetical protein